MLLLYLSGRPIPLFLGSRVGGGRVRIKQTKKSNKGKSMSVLFMFICTGVHRKQVKLKEARLEG